LNAPTVVVLPANFSMPQHDALALVEELAALSQTELHERLALLCVDDPALATRIARLLAPGARTQGRGEPLSRAPVVFAQSLIAGDTIGAYTLERALGVGGMANVWLAHRNDGALNRQVAIKLPLSPLPSALLAERFSRERDVLAQLDHPHIGKIFDAGITAHGQPFLALEFIDGEALDAYCRAKFLGVRARVQLIVDAAHALHHAHTRLVLHRDIKPSNMLVAHDGTLKLLDFGIAKLLSEDHTAEETQLTRLTGGALTPKYAAPEQLLNETVTTSTDVYALAVVLFELLCGELPFDAEACDMAGRLRTLKIPPRRLENVVPSAAFAITCGGTSASRLAGELAGDLSAIIEKAMRIAANERYASAQAFAEDLERYLSHHPVAARQGALLYRAQKFAQRQKIPLAIAASGLAMSLALGIQTWQARDDAKDSASRAASIDALLQGLFAGMSPDAAKSRMFTAKELLDQTSTIIDRTAADEKSILPHLRIGEIYRDIGAYDEAIVRFKKEREAATARGEPRAALLAQLNEINALTRAGSLDAAGQQIETAIEAAKPITTKPDALLARLDNLRGQIAFLRHDAKAAKAFYVSAESQWRALKPVNVEQLTWALEGHANSARNLADLSTAIEKMAEIQFLDLSNPVRGEMDRTRSAAAYGGILTADGRYETARTVLAPACEALHTRLGAAHMETRVACRQASFVLLRVGKFAEASALLDRLEKSNADPKSGEHVHLNFLRALIALYQGDNAPAEPAVNALLAATETQANGKKNDAVLRVQRLKGEVLLRQGQSAQALTLLNETLRDQRALLGDEHADTAFTRVLTALAKLNDGNMAETRDELSPAVAALAKARGEHHPLTLSARAYESLLSPDAPANAKQKIATRVRTELGWQAGAEKLAALMEGNGNLRASEIPIVF
jgi:eukaryotic-like serine/threonine-protein kinase